MVGNCFQHPFQILRYFIIPESQDGKALRLKKCSSLPIFLTLCMLSTVEFDDEFLFQAYEIDDVGANRMLATEFITCKTLGAEVIPKGFLNFGEILAERFCICFCALGCVAVHAAYIVTLSPTLSLKGEGVLFVFLSTFRRRIRAEVLHNTLPEL